MNKLLDLLSERARGSQRSRVLDRHIRPDGNTLSAQRLAQAQRPICLTGNKTLICHPDPTVHVDADRIRPARGSYRKRRGGIIPQHIDTQLDSLSYG